MNRIFSLFHVLIIFFSFSCNSLLAQSPDIEWQKCLGGSKEDRIYCVEQTKDGGFIVAGSTLSVDGDLSGNKGIKGAWLMKLHADGSIDWEKTYWSDSLGKIRNVRQTTDGGYVAIGDKTMKVDANGNVVWAVDIRGFDVIQSKDGVYVACGDTLTATDEILVRKFDSAGNIFWNFMYDGGQATSIKETSDGYIFTGFYNYDITTYGVLGKLNVNGDEIYVKDEDAGINDVALTRDGNYVFAGWNSTNANIKLIDPTGSFIWQASDSLSGSVLSSVRQTINGYVVCGQGNSASSSTDKVYVKSYDSTGHIIWNKLLGGSNNNVGQCIRQTTDGGFIIAGYTNSTDGDVTGNHGGYDGWIVKLKGSTGIKNILQSSSTIQVYPTITNGTVNILLPDYKDASIALLNSLGQRINANKRLNATHNTIDLDNYSNGLYILQVYFNGNMQSYKIIKE